MVIMAVINMKIVITIATIMAIKTNIYLSRIELGIKYKKIVIKVFF